MIRGSKVELCEQGVYEREKNVWDETKRNGWRVQTSGEEKEYSRRGKRGQSRVAG